jgi:hypothetical protein
MTRSLLRLALALMLTLTCAPLVHACPMCADAVTAGSGAEEDDAQREARAYNDSIYLMAGMPYVLLGGFSYWVYRGLRRQGLLNETRVTEAPRP